MAGSTEVNYQGADGRPVAVSTTNRLPVDLGSTAVSINAASVSVSNEVEVKNDTGNPIPVVNTAAPTVTTLLNNVTATGAGTGAQLKAASRQYQSVLTGTSGTYSATVKVQGSNDNTNWVDIGTITLSGTTTQTDAFASDDRFAYTRGNVTAISGTGATVKLMASA